MPEIEYVWDELSDNVIEEYEDGVLSVSYDHEPGLYGNLLSQNRNGVTSYYHYDGRGDTVALTDDSGNVTDTKEYDAWGNVIASTGSTVTPFQFGGRNGCQTGNAGIYVRARIYQPTVARWTSVDPLFLEAGPNVYEFVESSPLGNRDPSGMETLGTEMSELRCFTDCQSFVDSLDFSTSVVPGKGKTTCDVVVKCDPNCPSLGYASPPQNSVISICLNPSLFRTLDYELVFYHEFQHAKDFCKNPNINFRNCKECEKYEKNAHRINCGMIHPPKSAALRECVNCGVWASCKLGGACNKPRPKNCNKWSDLGIPDPGVPFP